MIWAIGLFILILFVFLFPMLLGKPNRQLEEVKRSFEIRESQLKRDFQFQSKELQRRLKSGDLAEEEWQELNDELAKDTAASLAGTSSASKSGVSRTMPLAFIAAILVVVAVAYTAYHFVGFYEESNYRKNVINLVSNSIHAVDNYREKANKERTQQALTDLYLALRVKADIEPDNFENWRDLSFFNANYGRNKEAQIALKIAQSVAPDNLDLRVDQAQMLTISGETSDIIKGHKLLSEVLKQDPNHQGALMVRGNSAFRVGMYDLAIMSWQKVLSQTDEQNPMYSALQDKIDEAQQIESGKKAPSKSPHSAQQAKPKMAEQKQPTAKATVNGIRVSIIISDEFLSSLSGNETLFVFARAVNGPKFPIAAVRTTVSQLGSEIVLSDAQAMQPQFALSKFDEVRIVARVSRTGSPTAVSGDIEGESAVYNKPFPTEVQIITLDKVVP